MESEMSADNTTTAALFHNISFVEFVSIINNVGAGGDSNYFMLPFMPLPLSPVCLALGMASAGHIPWAGVYLWECMCRPANLYTDVAAAKLLLSEAKAVAEKQPHMSILLTAVLEELQASAHTPASSSLSMDSMGSAAGRMEQEQQRAGRGIWGWKQARLQALGAKVVTNMKTMLAGNV
jgi:hypothetical protein